MNKSRNVLVAISLLSLVACGGKKNHHHHNDNVSPMPTLAKKGELKTNDKGKTITLTDENVIKENKIAEIGELSKGTQISVSVSSNYGDNVELHHVGMVATGDEAKVINEGTITSDGVLNRDATELNKYNIGIGMISNNEGTAENKGTITGKLMKGMAAYGEDSKVINNGEIKDLIAESSDKSLDINGNTDESSGLTSSGISVADGAYGINGTQGKIDGKLYIGMASKGQDSEIENLGEITIINPEYNIKYTEVNNDTENKFDFQDEFFGMTARDNSTATNSGEISMSGSSLGYGVAMYAQNSVLINNGTINLNNDNEVAMMAREGSKAVNNGTINLNANNGIGLYAEENSEIENGSKGIIYLSGSNIEGYGNIDSSNDGSKVQANLGKDSNGNVAMKIENGSKMINKGKIIFQNN